MHAGRPPTRRWSRVCSALFTWLLPIMNHACRAPADPSPIARVQHLVYMAAFFNKEAAAAAEISQVTRAYNGLVVANPPADAPTVAFIQVCSFEPLLQVASLQCDGMFNVHTAHSSRAL